jgi:ATP-dependent Clp protease ATP-binding subunit ClpA
MSDAYSDLTRRILDLAHEEAIRLDHAQVGPVHLLLALLREQSSRPGQVLRLLKVSVDRVRVLLKKLEDDAHPDMHSYPIPRSIPLQKAIEHAVELARREESPGPVQPEHLLAGLLREQDGTIHHLLQNMGVEPEDIQLVFLKRRMPPSPRTPTPDPGAPGADPPMRRGETDTAVDDTADPQEGDWNPSAIGDPRIDPFARFDEQARKVMQLATQEAQRCHHDYLGTEHVLLGIVKKGSGIAATVLQGLGLDLRTLRLEVAKIVPAGPAHMVTPGKLPPTPRVRKAIEYAVGEAQNLYHKQVGMEHLLLGLLRVEDGAARRVLGNMGLSAEHVRGEVLRLIGERD